MGFSGAQAETTELSAQLAQVKGQLGAREQEMRELEGDVTTAIQDVRDAVGRETAALADKKKAVAKAEEEREVPSLHSYDE